MDVYSELPSSINDYLLEVGSATNINDFCFLTLIGIANMIPFDNDGAFVIKDLTGFSVKVTFSKSTKWSELYNNYYCRVMPHVNHSRTSITNWRDFSNTEYATDFLFPQGIGYSITACHLGANEGFLGGIELYRSRGSSCFTQQEKRILDLLQPHLSNYFNIHTLLATYESQLPDASAIISDFPRLTRREAEIAALICRRYSTDMIASKLLISNLTVYRHISNIFEKLKVFNRDELRMKILNDYSVGDKIPR